MLARLDELSATLRTARAPAPALARVHGSRSLATAQVTEDVQSQQAALEPAFRNITAGLARDFAYVDGVGVRHSALQPSLADPQRLAERVPQALRRR